MNSNTTFISRLLGASQTGVRDTQAIRALGDIAAPSVERPNFQAMLEQHSASKKQVSPPEKPKTPEAVPASEDRSMKNDEVVQREADPAQPQSEKTAEVRDSSSVDEEHPVDAVANDDSTVPAEAAAELAEEAAVAVSAAVESGEAAPQSADPLADIETLLAEYGLTMESLGLTNTDGTTLPFQEWSSIVTSGLSGLSAQQLEVVEGKLTQALNVSQGVVDSGLSLSEVRSLVSRLTAVLQQPGPATEAPGMGDEQLQWLSELTGIAPEQLRPAERPALHNSESKPLDFTALVAGSGTPLVTQRTLNGEAATALATQTPTDESTPSTSTASGSPSGVQQPKINAQGLAEFSLTGQGKLPVGRPQWSEAVAEKVMFMASKSLTSAEIKLDPPELGQLQVRVSIQHDQATVTFVSPHSVVREALDQTAQRLREMFAGEGLNLVDVDVSDQSFREGREQSGQSGSGGTGLADEEEWGNEMPIQVKVSQYLVDQFV